MCSTHRVQKALGIAVLLTLLMGTGIVGTAAATPLSIQEDGNGTVTPTAAESGGEAQRVATESPGEDGSGSDGEDNSGLVDSIVGRVVGSITGELGKVEDNVIGGVADLIPDPVDAMASLIGAAASSIASGIAALLDEFNSIIFGLPAPGEYDDPSSWVSPTNNWWSGVWTTYWISAILGILFLLPAWMLTHSLGSRQQQREQFRKIGLATVMIFTGFVLTGMGYHLGNAVSLTLAPSGSEFLETPGNLSRLGLGLVIGILLLLTQSVIVIIGLLILLGQHVLAHIVVAFWPLFWTARAFPFPTFQSFGKLGTSLYVVLIMLKIIQAGTLRFLFELPFEIADVDATILALLATTAGLAIALIWFPKLFVRNVLPHSVVLGRGTARTGAEGMKNYAQSGGQAVKQRYREARGGSDASESPSSVESRTSPDGGQQPPDDQPQTASQPRLTAGPRKGRPDAGSARNRRARPLRQRARGKRINSGSSDRLGPK